MTSRHYRDRLILDTASANKDSIDTAISAWEQSSALLGRVAERIRAEGLKIRGEITGQSGDAMVAKFAAISDKLELDAKAMSTGSQALVVAAAAADAAIKTREGLDASSDTNHSPTKPEGPLPGAEPTLVQTQALATYNSNVAQYEAQEAAAEEKARLALQHLDQQYAEATGMMKEVHGEPDPQDQAPPGTPSGPGGPGAPGSPATPISPTGTPGSTPLPGNGGGGDGPPCGGVSPTPDCGFGNPPTITTTHLDPPTPVRLPPTVSPDPGPSTTATPNPGGQQTLGGPITNVVGQADSGSTFQATSTGSATSVASATTPGSGSVGVAAGGMAGAGFGAAMKGGLAGSSPALKAASVRSIGAGGRAGAPGALSRSTSASATPRGQAGASTAARSSAPGATGSRSAAAGSTSRTAGAGGRAGAPGSTARGGAATGATSKRTGAGTGTGKSNGKSKGLFRRGANGSTPGGRSASKAKDESATSAESLVYEQDWLGDDSVAPRVLD